MPGSRALIFGGILFLLSVLAFFIKSAGIPVFLSVAVMLLALVFMGRGALHMHQHLSDDVRQKYKERWGVDGLACFDAMIHMSVADGTLTRRERATIKDLTKRFFGETATNADIEHAAQQVIEKNIRIESVLGRVKDQLTLADKQMIIKASFLILQADGHADVAEQKLLKRIVTILGIPPEELIRLTADFVRV